MNPLSILTAIFGFFSKTDAGAKTGNAISIVAVIAALTPLALWAVNHTNDVFVEFTLTYGEAAFWGAILSVIVLVARGTRAG